MIVRLTPKIKAEERLIQVHGPLWVVEDQNDRIVSLRSLDMTLRYNVWYMTYYRMKLPKDGGLFFTIEEINEEPFFPHEEESTSWPILRKLLNI